MRAAIRVLSEGCSGTGRGPRPPSYHDQSHSRGGRCCEYVCLWRQLCKCCLCFPSRFESSAPPGVVRSAPDINASEPPLHLCARVCVESFFCASAVVRHLSVRHAG